MKIKLISGRVLKNSIRMEKHNKVIIFSQKFISCDEWSNVVFAKTYNGAALWF